MKKKSIVILVLMLVIAVGLNYVAFIGFNIAGFSYGGMLDAETVSNVFGAYISAGALADQDITGVKLVDLRTGDAADGKIEANDKISCAYNVVNDAKVIDVIYIVG